MVRIPMMRLEGQERILRYENLYSRYVYHNGKYLFCWTNQQKQQILGAFFYGYFVLQVNINS